MAEIAGNWLHVADPTGRMISHLEELVVPDAPAGAEGAAFEIRVHRVAAQTAPECLQGPASPEDCDAVVVADRGSLLLDLPTGRLAITVSEAATPPFTHPVDEAGWALLGLARGAEWDVAIEGSTLLVARDVAAADLPQGSADGKGLRVEKRFHRVPDGFAADLLTIAVELGTQPLVGAACVVDALAAEPGALEATAQRIGLAAPVIRRVRAIQAGQAVLPRSLTRTLVETTVMPFLIQAGDPSQPIAAPQAIAPESWEAAVSLARFHGTDPAAAAVLFPEALPMADRIGVCRDRMLGQPAP